MIVADSLSAGTAVIESIELIKNIDYNPKIFVVWLNRQEKGSGNLSASDELQNDFGITVKSIVDLNTLISFSETNADYQQFLDELKNYREEWGA